MTKKSPLCELSVVVPVYNEEGRVRAGLGAILDHLKTRPGTCQIIVVDDGSEDETVKIARELLPEGEAHRVIELDRNRGKGHAVRVGMLEAAGAIRLFTDIDLSVPIETLDVFADLLREGAQVVIGTRKAAASRVDVHQPFYRELLGGVFRWTSRCLCAPVVTDFTCGFKAFSASATEMIFRQSRINRWSFDAEILFLAYRMRIPIVQVPVRWTNSPDTRVNLATDMARSLVELLMIRCNSLLGRYCFSAKISGESREA